MEICQVHDGQLILNALYYDNLGLAAQVGLIPQTTTA